ncbi:glutamate-cysteine ligase catalytic subunit [Amylocystis lapponica]|nr:glutamate-cysteine ligase catalytic subunit [Amylocystis lapponica]
MGLLYLGTPLAWDEAKQYTDHVRAHGITQCGDELCGATKYIEYMVVSFNDPDKNAILAKLQSITNDIAEDRGDASSVPTFHPEYGRFMLESTPGAPYTGSLPDLLSVEADMRYREQCSKAAFGSQYLKPTEVPFTLTSYPRLVSSHSLFVPEEITNPHARFPTLTANIRRRRGSKVAINLPIFIDEKTPRPFVDPTIPWERNIYAEDPEAKRGAALTDHIYMDAMGFGMGCSCLQLTFQSCNVTEARRLYDALVPIAPLMLALTAASPLWRGYIADVDCRWDVVAASVDDRTEEERGLKPLKENRFRIPKSRYGSVSLYISESWLNRPEYNDIDAPFDEAIFTACANTHISHLFIRDPMSLLRTIHQDDANSNDHFETVRFKPPPVNSPIGWRVEFRSMEVQMTDFENAAYAVFIVLLSRAILSYNLNFYVPISKVDENMARAQKRDAVHSQKFYFRRDVFLPGVPSPTCSACSSGASSPVEGTNGPPRKDNKLRNCFPTIPKPENGFGKGPVEEEYEEMTMEEIMLGKCNAFPGLVGLAYAYLDTLDVDDDTRRRIEEYLTLVKRRADGSLKTAATWIREFVGSHPGYKRDSVVSQEMNYDLMVAVDEIERGVRKAPDFLPTKK